MKDRKANTETRQRIEAIFKPEPPRNAQLLAGMAKWAKELDDQFLAKARFRAQVREARALGSAYLPQMYKADARMEKVRAKARAAVKRHKCAR